RQVEADVVIRIAVDVDRQISLAGLPLREWGVRELLLGQIGSLDFDSEVHWSAGDGIRSGGVAAEDDRWAGVDLRPEVADCGELRPAGDAVSAEVAVESHMTLGRTRHP